MEWNVDDKTRSGQDREMHQYLDSVLFYVYDNAFRFCTGTNAYFSLLLTYVHWAENVHQCLLYEVLFCCPYNCNGLEEASYPML